MPHRQHFQLTIIQKESRELAICLGGDADTLAAIAGPMAYAHYRYIPQELIENAKAKLPKWMLDLNDRFDILCSE